MLLAQLQAFVETARRGSVTRAAEALFVTQPALTARLKSLERELGTPVLVRTGRGVKLSEAGRALLPYAQRALEEIDEGRRLAADVGRGSSGQLALGAAPAVSTYVLPAILERLHSAYPSIQLSVRTGHSEEVLDLVLRDQVEVGLVRGLRHPDIDSIPLYEDELVLVTHTEHRFARTGEIEIASIGEERFILFDRTSSYHDVTASYLRENGVIPRGVMELDNIDAAKKMVRQGLGIALLPYTAVAEELTGGLLGSAHIVDADPVRRQIVAIRRRDAGRPTGIVAALLDTIADISDDLQRAAA